MDEIIRNLYEYRELKKGIFWFTCEFTRDGEADFSESEIIYLSIPCNCDGDLEGRVILNSRNGTTFTHKKSWKELVSNIKELRKHPWNYYPRGRVEIFNGKAKIYLNLMILDCPNFKDILKRKFNLNDVYIQVIPDNSRHYACYGQDSSIK